MSLRWNDAATGLLSRGQCCLVVTDKNQSSDVIVKVLKRKYKVKAKCLKENARKKLTNLEKW